MTTQDKTKTKTRKKAPFKAEVSRLLELMAHSVYSDRRVFLRELISNASDACDRLRYDALSHPELSRDDPVFRIQITLDRAAATLTIADNGCGMSAAELTSNLGTIARSGTRAFLDEVAPEATPSPEDSLSAESETSESEESEFEAEDINAAGAPETGQNLIGRFGVGFYAVFMVAERVEVLSARAADGTEGAWHRWTSNGRDGFAIEPIPAAAFGGRFPHRRGTRITLFLRPDAEEFLDSARIKADIVRFSDHIGFPIELIEIEAGKPSQPRTVNAARALWTRSKSEITPEEYREFYRHIAGAADDPLITLHYHTEGRREYHVLVFIPERRPPDIYEPHREIRLKLYVRRVFITEDAQLLPPFLRFVRGVVDSADLPLNISREMLQKDPQTAALKAALTRRILSELQRRADKEAETYNRFWEQFGAVIKEGLYEAPEHRDALLKLARFRTTEHRSAPARSLDDYITAMPENQKTIYYLTGDSSDFTDAAPQLEGFVARGIEVLLLSDPVDNFWISSALGYDGKAFKSVLQADDDLSGFPFKDDSDSSENKIDPVSERQLATLIAAFKQALGEKVGNIRKSKRLISSPVCLVAGEGGIDPQLDKLLRMRSDYIGPGIPPILELNPDHALIRALSDYVTKSGYQAEFEDIALLLLDQARILNGEAVYDSTTFARRLSTVLRQNLDLTEAVPNRPQTPSES